MSENDLRAIAFPTVDPRYLAALEHCTKTVRRRFRAGEKLFEAGDRLPRFFVVKSGEIEIVDESRDVPTVLARHGPGNFSGTAAQLAAGPALVSAYVRIDTEVYEISNEALREILNKYPDLASVILQAFLARRELLEASPDYAGVRVIGSRYSQDTFRIRDFLTKNRVPFRWLDLESDPHVDQLLKQFAVSEADTPVVAFGHRLLKNPTNRELAEALGILRPIEHTVYDLTIVGAGPAGLAAAVYAASEGLKTVVLERYGPGGQAGRSMLIENYLGFPAGISGGELADRAMLQANKFGAIMPVPTPVYQLTFENQYPVVHLDNHETVTARCLLIASGADYRRLTAEGCERFEGRGVFYAATPNEATMCRDADVVVVGGGNSAGQAAVFLSREARKVYVAIRHDNLRKDMSSYLAWRIEQTPNIEMLFNTELRRIQGDSSLGEVELVNNKTGKVWALRTPAVFSFIGAVPHTDWLPPEIEKDEKDFVRTGSTVMQSKYWTVKRQPFLLETSRPGVFAAGDVRSGSVKRVASAVGEGAMAVQFVHAFLSGT
jgi:thioredoxin reductase (NADPH)